MTIHPYSYYQNQEDNLVDVPVPDKQFSYNPYNDPTWQKAYADSMTPALTIPSSRSTLDRVLDVLSTPLYASAGFADGLVKGENPLVDMFHGISAGNPFGAGNPNYRYTYSNVLEDSGWKPTSLFGKIAKGALGFAGDVLLDPTTYLSGGTSALIKGAGEGFHALDALKNVADNPEIMDAVGNLARNKAMQSAIDSGADSGVAQQIGDAAYQTARSKPVTQMTPDIAEAIVRNKNAQTIASGFPGLSEDQIAQGAQNLSDKFNSLIGLQKNQSPLTLSLGNAPFGHKLFGWTGLADKKLEVFGTDQLHEMSKTLGLQEAWSQARNAFYGSKVGSLLSTTSPLYKYAQNDPAKLWNILHFSTLQQGMDIDKRMAEANIRNYVSGLGLEPAEAKEVLNILQDKTMYSKIQSTVNFADTAEAQQLKNKYQTIRDNTSNELDSLQQQKDALDNLRFAHENSNTDFSDQISQLEQELQGKIQGLNSAHVAAHADANQQMQLLQTMLDEANRAKAEAHPYQLAQEGDKSVTPDDVIASHGEWQQQAKDLEAYHQLQDTVSNTSKDSPEYLQAQDKLAQMDGAPRLSGRFDTIDKLSQLLFGKSGAITHSAHEDDIMGIMNELKKGTPLDEVKQMVEDRPALMSDRYKQMYQAIAKELKYGSGTASPTWSSWMKNHHYDELNDAYQKAGGQLPPMQMDALINLSKVMAKRQNMIRTMSRMNDTQFYKHLSDMENKRIADDFYNRYEEETLNANRTNALRDQSAGAENPNKSASDIDSMRRGLGPQVDNHFQVGDINTILNRMYPGKDLSDLTTEQQGALKDALLREQEKLKPNGSEMDDIETSLASRIPGGKDITPAQVNFVKNVAGEMQDVLNHVFKRPWSDLTDKQKNFAMNLAQESYANKVMGGKGVQDTKFMQDKALAAQQEAEQRALADKNYSVMKDMGVGTDLRYIPGGKGMPIRATVDSISHDKDGNPLLNVIHKKDGATAQIKPSDVAGIVSKPVKLAEEQIKESPVAQDAVRNLDEIQQSIDTLKNHINNMDLEHKAQTQALMDSYTSRINDVKTNMTSAEEANLKLQDALKGTTPDLDARMSTLANRLTNMDAKLSSDDAFESYIRNKYGDKFVDDAVKNQFDAGAIVLDSRTDISDKVKTIAKELRKNLQDMGYEEAGIGKLGKEQLEAHLNDYVSHLLTPDGAKFIKDQGEVEKTGVPLTKNLGYGRKFNPFRMSRTIKEIPDPENPGAMITHPTIDQINKHFETAMKGKNLFSDNLSDIYIARAMKHVELMYDDKYMKTMMNQFGHELKGNTADEGYKAVINYGQMKQMLHDLARSHMSMQISQDVSQHIRDNLPLIQAKAQRDGIDMSTAISDARKDFMAQNYPKERLDELYSHHMENGANLSGLTEGALTNLATPMVTLTPEQVDGLRAYHKNTLDAHHALLNMNEQDAIKYGNDKQLEYINNTRNRLNQIKEPNIVQVDDAIVQKANQARKIQIAKDTNNFLKMYDKFTHFIKLNMTTIMPSFHMRNKMSNAFLNWLGVGADAVNPKLQVNVWKLVKNGGDDSTLKESLWPVKNQDGSFTQTKWSDIYRMARDHNVIDDGYFAKDMGVGTVSKGGTGILPKFLPAKFDPTDKHFIGYEVGAKFGNQIENTDRLIHFASKLKQGATPEEAAASVHKYLFDYGDLTAFEQNVMKRLMPFYTWMRKNTPLQFHELLMQPGKYQLYAKATDEINNMNNQDERVNPDLMAPFTHGYLQLPFSIMSKSHTTQPILLNPNMPTSNIDTFDLSHPGQTLTGLFNALSPILTTPISQATNYNYFLDRPITNPSKAGDNPLLDRFMNVAKNNAMFNAGAGLNTTDANKATFNLIGDLTGIKMMPYDYNTYKDQYIRQLQQQEGLPVPDKKVHHSVPKNNIGMPLTP